MVGNRKNPFTLCLIFRCQLAADRLCTDRSGRRNPVVHSVEKRKLAAIHFEYFLLALHVDRWKYLRHSFPGKSHACQLPGRPGGDVPHPIKYPGVNRIICTK
ncbi:hypothetical protein D3C86_1289460 [compost metagenome]